MTAEYFDQWFADMRNSDARDDPYATYLGVPPEVGASNVLPFDGLREVCELLRLATDSELVDLACGRGGPGLWIARETGATLIGIDFSAEAVEQASQRRQIFGMNDRASYAVGSLDDTGLSAGAADAVVCIDAIQFSSDGLATAQEVRRILRPAGRLVLTTWEAVNRDDEAVSERLRAVDIDGWLRGAGFQAITVVERPEWHAAALRMWQAAVAHGPSDDPALQSVFEEGQRSVEHHDKLRRILATATAP
jgi:ubiquinone/menaquinone biosynthesis C-methylase UbiE